MRRHASEPSVLRPSDGVPAFVTSEWFAKAQLAIMIGMFSRALDAPAPNLRGMPTEKLLRIFALFSARCAAEAIAQPDGGAQQARRLFGKARQLGRRVRALPPFRRCEPAALAAAFYHNIGIGLAGELPGELSMGPCYFSAYYTPEVCSFMSAFDAGIMSGIAGTGILDFESRITQGAPTCCARFSLEGDRTP